MTTLTISPYPYCSCERIPVGILRSSGTIEENGSAKILYCDSPKPALRYVRDHGGTALMSSTRGSTRWIRFETNGKTIYPGTYCSDMEEIVEFRDYCHSKGIPASGIAAMGIRLMRYTLPGYFEVNQGEGIPWKMFAPGARMHSKPGVYSRVAQADIVAAYLWSIGQQSPVLSFEETSKASQKDIREYPGSWSLISYRYNERPQFGILPSIREDKTTGFPVIPKIWHGPILVSSYDLLSLSGVDISIHKSWLATQTVSSPFRAFMHLMIELRERFPSLAKQAGNSLWGSFGASTDLAKVTYIPGNPKHKIQRIPPRPALSIPIAALTLSRLRAEMSTVSQSPSTIHVHTDGFMTTSLSKYPRNTSGNPGEWRLANQFQEVEIHSPSWYRTVDSDGVESFKLAGRPERGQRARAIFRHSRDRDERLF